MYTANINNILVYIHKNLKSLENFPDWTKGLLTKDGDLYMMEYDYKSGNVFHDDLVRWLYQNGNIQSKEQMSICSENPFNFLKVVIYDDYLFLSDSYSQHIKKKLADDIKKIFEKSNYEWRI